MSEFQSHDAIPESGNATPQSSLAAPQTIDESPALNPSAAQPITKRQQVCCVASQIFERSADWVTFFREVLGADGIARRVFSKPEEMELFEKTEEYAEIQLMVAKLRERSRFQSDNNEPTRVITVRMPKSLHEFLKAESYQRRTSMNQLCISKLLQIIDNDLVPSD